MSTVKLIGTDNNGTIPGSAPSQICLTRWTALSTGTVTQFKIHICQAGNVKLAVYADNNGSPGALLGAVNNGQAVSVGWNTLSFPETPVTKDSIYWLAQISDISSGNYIYYNSDTGHSFGYKSQTYAGFSWPDPISGVTIDSGYYYCHGAYGILKIAPPGVAQLLSCGLQKLRLSIRPPGAYCQVACGMLTVMSTGIIGPPGMPAIVSCGAPSLIYRQILWPPASVSPVTYGIPAVGTVRIIGAPEITQVVIYGSPTILKYVWHVILEGRYALETPEVNRACIIGRDAGANLVYGMAEDSTEVGLVGERLDFRQEPAVTCAVGAADIAAAVLARMRLSKANAVIVIPPNCGQELCDAVQIWDSAANQAGVKFRVAGIRFEYNPRQARCEHRLILGNP